MIAFIDDQREAYGFEPICRVLPIAPSIYRDHVTKRAGPTNLSVRAKRDEAVRPGSSGSSRRPSRSMVPAKSGGSWGARGFPYVSILYTEHLAEADLEPSVGSVGASYENTRAETINGLYKAELIHRRGPWRSFEAVEFVTLTWGDRFNNRRLLEPICKIPPAETEPRFYASLDEHKLAARPKANSVRQSRGGSPWPKRGKIQS